jgi:hypothetical protein
MFLITKGLLASYLYNYKPTSTLQDKEQRNNNSIIFLKILDNDRLSCAASLCSNVQLQLIENKQYRHFFELVVILL